MLRARAAISEPSGEGLTLETVEIHDDRVVVAWCSTSLVTPWPPEHDGEGEPRHEPLALSDDVGTRYECSDGSASFHNGSRGSCSFVPGPPPNATRLSVATTARTYDLPF